VHDGTHRGADPQADAIGNTVADVKELDPKGRNWQDVAGANGMQVDIDDPGLAQLDLDQPAGQPRGVHRRLDAAKQVGQRAHVVLMAVGHHDSLDAIGTVEHILHVGDDDVDAEHVVLGKHEPGVDDNHAVAVLDHQHVPPDLAEPTQGDDAQSV